MSMSQTRVGNYVKQKLGNKGIRQILVGDFNTPLCNLFNKL